MIGNLSELSSLPGMPSEPTIKQMIADNPGFPGILKRGDRGIAWEIDLKVASLFIRDLARKADEDARARVDQVAQFGLELLGADAMSAGAERVGISASERKALIEEELLSMKLAERRGELIRKAEVEAALGSLLVTLQQRFLTLPDRFAKLVGLTREQLAQLERITRADLGWVAGQLEKLKDVASTREDDSAVRDGRGSSVPDGTAAATERGQDGLAMGA